ncbi:unnamed protein product [Bursaphelenchus xylophilus]|uniref:(pine wood nematode) hypothetical protein n=1 Tax=Bursaphelenchus xylophilus TaxID=6326 RepID=A0A1I7RN72_BURXY|nr:unnamed protein product [Bursaphelenchus xylophilus]CAG9123713.1 unnamed protein product [Bursaphelenchus xylophilus]
MGVMDDSSDLAVPDVPLARSEDDSESNSSFSIKEEDQLNRSNNGLGEHLSVSLEDLVEHFDQKINNVLKDLNENTNKMAPVQVRTQDEIMSESQVWWTLTGNYGNILPLDFNKSQIRKREIDVLSLDTPKASDEGAHCSEEESLDEEDLRHSMDLHQIIPDDNSLTSEHIPVSADQVIEEIDEIMQTCDLMRSMMTDKTESVDSMYSSMRSPFASLQVENELKQKHIEALSFSKEDLTQMSQSKLLALSTEMENLIITYNSELVSELARRDELEYENEIKNKFITLLVGIQDKRRKFMSERKKKKIPDNAALPQFATASIPFDDTQRFPKLSTLESLIKILEAINENKPQVPTLLTDYILTVVCPSASLLA